jgi:hypothetical protein
LEANKSPPYDAQSVLPDLSGMNSLSHHGQAISQLAEGVGFEPTFAKKAKAVFKTATISHSVTPPGFKFYFKATPSGNLADLLPSSLPHFDPT